MTEPFIICREPGWYQDQIGMDDYHGPELTEEYALSSSGAVEILESPLTFWAKSWMNPDWEPEQKEAFDIGKALHLLVLEADMFAGQIQILNYDDWKTKAAKEERASCYASGVTPLLSKDYQMVLAMRDAIANDPTAQTILAPGNKPLFEQTFISQDEVSRRLYRTRPDVFVQAQKTVVDVKTTTAADADAFARVISENSYHQRGAWQIDEINAVMGKQSVTRFIFLTVTKPKPPAPPLVNVLELDPDDIARGRALNVAAKGLFHYCMTTDIWPPLIRNGSMQPVLQSVMLPPWARTKHDDIAAAGWLERFAALRGFHPEEEKS